MTIPWSRRVGALASALVPVVGAGPARVAAQATMPAASPAPATLPLPAAAPGATPAAVPLSVRPVAERRVTSLPAGPLAWRVETMPTLAAAQAAAGPWSLAAAVDGRNWLFTLGAPGAATTPGATRVAEVGPIPRVDAAEWLLRINDVTGPPGAVTPVHSHPGSEAFYVVRGEQSIRGADGTMRVAAGHTEAGHGAGHAMQVSSSGDVPLQALVMFVVDAARPFSVPATLP